MIPEYNTMRYQKMNMLHVSVYFKMMLTQWDGLNVQMTNEKYGAMETNKQITAKHKSANN